MIVQSVIMLIIGLVRPLVMSLPDISLDFLHGGVAQTFLDWIAVAAYMLPMNTLKIIAALVIDILIIRIVIAFIKAIWGLLPVV